MVPESSDLVYYFHTRIPQFTGSTVTGRKSWFYYSISEIMSWASQRVTTRKEDIPYSLMGLFGIHMPILYGEGSTAFLRLQTEILKVSDDESIFAWSSDDWHRDRYMNNGLLAPSPSLFAGCCFKPSRGFDTQRTSTKHFGIQRDLHIR
jgi:hypothetical protein